MRDTLRRRQFLAQVGQGMVATGIGWSAATELGLAADTPPSKSSAEKPARLNLGKHERLASHLAETPAERVIPLAIDLLGRGATAKELIAAAALANARAFGGEHYEGFHTFMAMAPSLHMAAVLSGDRQHLPVLKVLHRNARFLQSVKGPDDETLHAHAPPAAAQGGSPVEQLRSAVHDMNLAAAEDALARLAQTSPEAAWNGLLPVVGEAPEVHRVVLAHRAWDMLELAGPEHATTLLRESVHYCVKNEKHSHGHFEEPRTLLPKLLDQYKLGERTPGERRGDDAWVEKLSQSLFHAKPAAAAEIVAGLLADGFSGDDISEAISLAANQLVLRDAGRPAEQSRPPQKPVGSVHGDSIGVHAADSANAWRHIARVGSARNRHASLILAGWQVAFDRVNRGGAFLEWKPRPYAEHLAKVTATEPERLLAELDEAIRGKNQEQACAVVHRYGELGHTADGVVQALLKYAISEDGALHAEKYFRTATDEFKLTRAAFRGRQLVALARVTASEYGHAAPGYAQACELLKVKS